MEYLKNIEVVFARTNEDGVEEFADPGSPAERFDPGALESLWLWAAPTDSSLPANLGRAPDVMRFPGPGGSQFGIVCLPPHSAGKRRFDRSHTEDPNMRAGNHTEPSMHATDTLDYDVILSGKVDLELGSGEVRTLGPGTCVILGGVAHAWKNHYDEPCILAAAMIGTGRTE
ncbi:MULTISPECIES: hypothetical protein [unclassified Streptomyces]|uniref:hypothetical protein n=1 Tax=unclassified Streptomyces TaxID=2593676 RepID=UPI00288B9120|nr:MULTISPECIES: hypothetical protein [unclassified Streptomyces]WNI21428.1 hypothetical protein RLT58_05575 [Streptomyces sp. ITFR-16]WNI28247.1 hypothetical protein RLT59_05240 [Streptomyces sp. ITFR-6]